MKKSKEFKKTMSYMLDARFIVKLFGISAMKMVGF